MRVLLLSLLIICFGAVGVLCQPVDSGHYLNQFAVRLQAGRSRETAEQIALDHGFRVTREVPSINAYIMEHPEVNHRSKRSAENEMTRLQQDPRISHVQQEVVLKRVKRVIVHDKQFGMPIKRILDDSVYKRVPSISLRDNLDSHYQHYSDPKFDDMWYLINRGQSGGERGLDMNVAVVWENGITGKGIVVCILDDGVDHRHPDLKDNYDPDASTDLNDKDDSKDDPMPDTHHSENSHGTRCAGEVAAAANNDVCGVGVAYDARIGGVRVLDGPVTDILEAEALKFNNQYIHIYSASWGPDDDGGTMEGPRHFALEALEHGAKYGRGGLGSLFVWATGNGGMNGDSCSADGYVSRPETLSVGSVTDWGKSPFFMENCSSTLAVVPSGGEAYKGQESEEGYVKLKVITTDMNGGCIENFQGTSSAAPLAAGCMANVLQANPLLSWRDVQHIVIRGSRIPSADTSWTINGAGHHVSHRFGFGLMDCGKMVELAQQWDNFPEQLQCNITRKNYQLLPRKGKLSDKLVYNGCEDSDSPDIDRLEHVQVYIRMSAEHRGDVAIYLTSPSGTRSKIMSARPRDRHVGDWEFMFMTVHTWDENPNGEWSLEIQHQPAHDDSSESVSFGSGSYQESLEVSISDILNNWDNPAGYLKEWSIKFLGTHGTRHDRTAMHSVKEQQSYRPSEDDVLELKEKEIEISKRVQVKRSTVSKKTMSNVQDIRTDKTESRLLSDLWEALHSKGARDVKKRVLDYGNDASLAPISKRKETKKSIEDMSTRELVHEIVRLLDEVRKRR